ncbi:MAG: 3-isopropylmalate dehydratase small subunit [Anaerolineae bacterium]|nr:3-isopropylmalate dehydratase small subunit [Anaerolineae bacterium]MCO5195504.1 3-isopropylmalate dehydratase small subunit [Anaerolineae bacterium]
MAYKAKQVIRGAAHVYGDNIDTDRIIPGKYTKTLDLSHLADHVLEDLDPTFRDRVQPGDILVAGDNFGCGSSREQAPLALKATGVSVVVASYFARIFFRNAINIGLPVVEIGRHTIADGTQLEVDLARGEVRDLSAEQTYAAAPLPDIMLAILDAGGLVRYLQINGDYGDN